MNSKRPTNMEGAYHLAKQKFEETDREKEFRKTCGFKDIEANMPDISCRYRGTFADKITSYLGKRNPFAHPANPKLDTIWLLDNTAYQEKEGGPWQVQVTSSYFLKNSGKDESAVIAKVASVIGLADDDEADRETLKKRLHPFLDTVQPSRTVEIMLNGKHRRQLGPSNSDGLSNDVFQFCSNARDGDTATSYAVGLPDVKPLTTTFATQTGWAVMSDIDDTIKLTMTSSPIGILRTTFVQEPIPIKGMPELYASLREALNNPPFWYLSASPYNLYPFLREFRDKFYPPGTLLLREASWMNLAGFLASLTQGTQAYKVSRMKMVQRNFPRRKFLCIGDSTQSDPEAYGEMYRTFPGWVGAIFIRKVNDVEPMNESQKNSAQRFEEAFKHVPRDVWTVFEDPNELADKVRSLRAVRNE